MAARAASTTNQKGGAINRPEYGGEKSTPIRTAQAVRILQVEGRSSRVWHEVPWTEYLVRCSSVPGNLFFEKLDRSW